MNCTPWYVDVPWYVWMLDAVGVLALAVVAWTLYSAIRGMR